ncbi:MAG: hypothetical protein AUJ12_02190 [Alphaproteobacteria bacterium CG1_02_46_17]|nr:MAG: hypothetical protein AUJ12_02190 [Alphaproteobacteria bacterium CG1_02_46_17]
MADIKLDKTQKFCDRYSEELNRIFPNTTLHYILHYRGQKPEQIAKLLPNLHNHPAYDEAVSLLKFRSPGHDNSAFLGMVIGFKKSMLGLKKSPECLAFVSINLNQHDKEEDLHFAIHALTAHFLETVDFYTRKHAGTQSNQILQPKRNNISTCRLNLKSDVYSVLQMTYEGYDNAVENLARKRAHNAVTPQTGHPEEFPYPISLDVTKFAIDKFISAPKKSAINSAYTLARHVAASFDLENIETWINFVNPAQTMAWSGYKPSQILSAALNASSNPFLKSTAHMMGEILDIEPAPLESLPSGYNPFALPEVNYIQHERSVEETFEMVLIHAMEADSHLPLIHVANNQNEGLLKGRFSGWCAHALQSAATAYTTASMRGMPSGQAARLEFQSAKQQTGWKELNHIGSFVTDSHKNGKAVTLSGISEWCEHNPQYKAIMESINMTLADPVFARKLEASAEMPSPGPLPQAAPQRALSHNFVPQMAPAAAPGLGLGGGGMGGGNFMSNPPSRQKPAPSELLDFNVEDKTEN